MGENQMLPIRPPGRRRRACTGRVKTGNVTRRRTPVRAARYPCSRIGCQAPPTVPSLFGILAPILASIGVYGIKAYNVGSRTNEIGVLVAPWRGSGQHS